MHCILYCVCIYVCNEFSGVFRRITEQGWSSFHRRENHVSKSWMQRFTITDGGFYSVLLNPATKLDPVTAEVKVDWCLLSLWLFCSCTVNNLRWDKNLSGTKDIVMPCWQNPEQEGSMQVKDDNWGHTLVFSWKLFLFVGKKKEKNPHSKSNTNNDASRVFTFPSS